MNILVSGATGLIGAELVRCFNTAKAQVFMLARGRSSPQGGPWWDPAAGKIDLTNLPPLDAVVHLAGENVAGRWTATKMKRIRDSRIDGTRLLCVALSQLPQRPKVALCASAIGFYGDRGDELLDERSAGGQNFLANVCREWEAATAPAAQKGIRVVNLRFGMVLSRNGGALRPMLFPFSLGLGGKVGNGRQYWSWITHDDVMRAVNHTLMTEELADAVNVVTPNPVTNLEFTRALGRVLQRPTPFPLPAFVARAVFGQMADELLLASARVQPARLVATGFQFQHQQLEPTLRQLLDR
jgi:uncharacterized protein (TIGR01777 family)